MKRALWICLLCLVLISLGCISRHEKPLTEKELCLQACIARRDAGSDLSTGPCLGQIGEDWVCDVAHSPRVEVDDNPDNQCPQYRLGDAHHFVEVTPDCKFIMQN
ncbi:MAG: hypothetical protein ABH829_01060 [archaeon]